MKWKLYISSLLLVLIIFYVFASADEVDVQKPSPDVERFERYDIGTILIAGLADGVNPCSFATIAFLISTLFYIGADKNLILGFGLTFCISSFITYLSISLGLFYFLLKASAYHLINVALTFVLGIFSLTVAVISLRDMYVYEKTKKAKDLVGKLPSILQKRIHYFVRKYLTLPKCIISGLLLGVLITMFEFACSGQLLVPTLFYIIKSGKVGIGLKQKALVYLVLYNICFVLPMMVAFLITFFGTTHKSLVSFLSKRLALIKLILGLIFLWFAIVLIGGSIGKL